MQILVTGAAGFIGYHLCHALLEQGHEVIGLDNLNDYYDVVLKQDRLNRLVERPGFVFERADIAERSDVERIFDRYAFDRVVNLAAQAGVRYSIENPHVYAQSNLVGFLNILEGCRHQKLAHLIYASSSSVYGVNETQPFSESHAVDHPVSLYAATKKSNEMMAHTYASLYGLPVTGLRFFTVYGPWGRPDMAPFKFTQGILEGKPIDLYNQGVMERDFTYIDDIIDGVVRVIDHIPTADPDWTGARPRIDTSYAPYRLYNIGNNKPVKLLDFIAAIEQATGKTAVKNLMPMQDGDVPSTYADISELKAAVGFEPKTGIVEGMQRFVDWYLSYYAEPSRGER